jgi:MGT family glycosyltransferase
MIPRILFFSLPAQGHVNVTLPMVREFVRRGTRVDYYSLEWFRERIEGAGAVFHGYGSRFYLSERGLGPSGGVARMVDELLDMTGNVLGDHLDSARALEPACVMHDYLAPWGAYAAQALNAPEATSIPTIAVDSKIALGAATGGPDLRVRGQQILAKIAGWTSALSALNQRFGLPGYQSPLALMQAYSELNVVFVSREFQPHARGFDDRFKFVGTNVPAQNGGPPFPFEALDGRPLMYIAVGTVFLNRALFLRTCLEAFRDSRWQVVMATGLDPETLELGPLPENFLVRKLVPQSEIIRRASLFITHGGTNSISEAMWYGVPMLVSPGGGDQYWVADRIAELGAGQNLAGMDVTAELLRERVDQIASQPQYAEASAKLGETLRAAGGAVRAVDEVEAYLLRKGTQALR